MEKSPNVFCDIEVNLKAASKFLDRDLYKLTFDYIGSKVLKQIH